MSFAELMKGPDTIYLLANSSIGKRFTLRQVGWIVGGGPRDGEFLPWGTPLPIPEAHGSFSPVYMEIGD